MYSLSEIMSLLSTRNQYILQHGKMADIQTQKSCTMRFCRCGNNGISKPHSMTFLICLYQIKKAALILSFFLFFHIPGFVTVCTLSVCFNKINAVWMDTPYPHTNSRHNNRRFLAEWFHGMKDIARNIDRHLSAWSPPGKIRIPDR